MKEEPSLWLKFSGEELDVRSVPIYELGDTLVAIQRSLTNSPPFILGTLPHCGDFIGESTEEAHSFYLKLARGVTS